MTGWAPSYSPWRHGGWYVSNVHYSSGAVGCVSRNYADRQWRIVCEGTGPGVEGDRTFRTRDEAARAEFERATGHPAPPVGMTTVYQGDHTQVLITGNGFYARCERCAWVSELTHAKYQARQAADGHDSEHPRQTAECRRCGQQVALTGRMPEADCPETISRRHEVTW